LALGWSFAGSANDEPLNYLHSRTRTSSSLFIFSVQVPSAFEKSVCKFPNLDALKSGSFTLHYFSDGRRWIFRGFGDSIVRLGRETCCVEK